MKDFKLTVDILKESGWDVRETYGSIPEHYITCSPNHNFLVHFYDDGTIDVDCRTPGKCVMLDNIQYVHELQQALLVAGLSDKLELKPYKEQ